MNPIKGIESEYMVGTYSGTNIAYESHYSTFFICPSGEIRIYLATSSSDYTAYVTNIYVYMFTPYYTFIRSSDANIVMLIAKANNYGYAVHEPADSFIVFTIPNTDTSVIQFTGTNITFLSILTDVIVLFSGVV